MKTIRARRGFTLLELLVAISITLALAGVLLSVTTGTLSIWRRVQGNFSNSTQAKLALDYLERDLHSAIHRSDTTKWLALDLTNDPVELTKHGWAAAPAAPGSTKPATAFSYSQPLPGTVAVGLDGITRARFALGGAWLRFVTLNPANFPVVVAYQIVRRPPPGLAVTSPPPAHYLLYRTELTPADTLATGYDVGIAAYTSAVQVPAAAVAPTSIGNPVLADMLADNVVDFGVWFYARNANGSLLQLFPENNSDLQHGAIGNGTLPGNRYPEVADVMVRILSDEGAALLENMENGRGRSAVATDVEWWALVEQHSQVFVRRIELKGGAL